MSKTINNIFWCKSCLNMSTRPRITFDKDGKCNACTWSEEKKNLDWKKRETQLKKIIDETKSSSKFDCIVPVSGGKDGTYVADQLINKYSLKPLCITIKPPLELEIGKKNLSNFLKAGIDHIHINPDYNVMAELDKIGFLKYGQGWYGWMTAIHTVPFIIAGALNIKLIVYGEDGEVEYGGTSKNKYAPVYGAEYQKKVYLNDTYEDVLKTSKLSDKDLYWYKYQPIHDEIKITHYGYFENWDPYRNYIVAKEKYNLIEKKTLNSGTFTNFAQNDQTLTYLHYYLMYLKLGFGRATQDAGIEIRRGAMSRDAAKNLVKLYDGIFPEEHIQLYMDYYGISENEFYKTLDVIANKNLFEKTNKIWKPKFDILEV